MSSLPIPPSARFSLAQTTNPNYVITLGFGSANRGATEQYITPALGTTQAILTAVETMVGQRMALSSQIVSLVGVRVAQYATKRQSFLLLPGKVPWPNSTLEITLPARGTYAQDGSNGDPSEFRASMNCKVGYGLGRVTTRYICSPPSGVVSPEPVAFFQGANPTWFQKLRVLTGNLVSTGWSIRGQLIGQATTYYPIGQIVNGTQTTPLLGLLFPTAPGPVPSVTLGTRVAIQGTRAASGSRGATINGVWSVQSSNTTDFPGNTVVYLQNSQGNNAASLRVTSNSVLRIQAFQLFPISSWTPYRTGIHKRGNVPFASRGRRLSRATLVR